MLVPPALEPRAGWTEERDMPDGPWWERDGALARLHRQLEPLNELAASIDTPAIRAIRATFADWDLVWTPEGQAVLAERERERAQERHRAAVAAQKLVADIAAVVPCLAEQLARERTPGWSTPAEDAEEVARRRAAYLAGWHAVHEVQPYVRLGRKRPGTKRTPASVLSLADQQAWVWQYVRAVLRNRYRTRHYGGGALPLEMPELTPPLSLLGDQLAPPDQILLLEESLREVVDDLPPDQRQAFEAKVRAKLAG
jgi:hypothetical protein